MKCVESSEVCRILSSNRQTGYPSGAADAARPEGPEFTPERSRAGREGLGSRKGQEILLVDFIFAAGY